MDEMKFKRLELTRDGSNVVTNNLSACICICIARLAGFDSVKRVIFGQCFLKADYESDLT